MRWKGDEVFISSSRSYDENQNEESEISGKSRLLRRCIHRSIYKRLHYSLMRVIRSPTAPKKKPHRVLLVLSYSRSYYPVAATFSGLLPSITLSVLARQPIFVSAKHNIPTFSATKISTMTSSNSLRLAKIREVTIKTP